jgi:hypothetical protein
MSMTARHVLFSLCVFACLDSGLSAARSQLQAGVGSAPPQSAPAASSKAESSTDRLARGKKLVLTDGTFQLVRSYERKDDRVRYFSLERNDWEELPASMIDWDATAKAQVAAETADATLVSKIHKQEEATKVETVLDVDASLQVAPGVFLPPGEGMFVLEGRSVTPLSQVGTAATTDKKTVLKQVLSPVKIIPSKENIEIPGAKSSLRVTTASPEFYLREDFDPNRDSSIERTGRPSEFGPEVELVRATVKGNKRHLESLRSLFGQPLGTDRKSVSIQRWEVARTVFRFTLSEPLPPGEYALAEILPDRMNGFVWDFGVDSAPAAKVGSH